MSYRAYHDRDVITCITLSDRPVARKGAHLRRM